MKLLLACDKIQNTSGFSAQLSARVSGKCYPHRNRKDLDWCSIHMDPVSDPWHYVLHVGSDFPSDAQKAFYTTGWLLFIELLHNEKGTIQ